MKPLRLPHSKTRGPCIEGLFRHVDKQEDEENEENEENAPCAPSQALAECKTRT